MTDLAISMTDDWQPDSRDPHERFGVTDSWEHPGKPLAARIIAAVADEEPRPVDMTDGVDSAVVGLLADQEWRGHVAMADAMGLVGDWGTDDVVDAVTEAMHRYRRTFSTPTASEPAPADPSVDEETAEHLTVCGIVLRDRTAGELGLTPGSRK